MNNVDKVHAEALKEALLSLDPSGPDGFEGLLGIILGAITGQSFRLAKSGSQLGRDGDSAFDGGATFFEGKRYKEGLSKNDISVKLFDVGNDDVSLLDLWILGATCEVASQTVDAAKKFATKNGFGIVILDWSNNDLGALLVATIVGGAKSKEFIRQNLTGGPGAGLILPAVAAIDHFAKHADLPSRTSSLRRSLTEDVGLGHAKALNQAWVGRLLKNKRAARAELGQPLSPLDPSGPLALDRPERTELTNAFSGSPDSDIYAIVGEEGVGKSWLAVQSWNLSHPQSLLVICPADDLTGDGTEDLDDFLIRKLLIQTGLAITDPAIARWKRRFIAWRANTPASSVRLTLIADGLNQPLKSNWGRWLDRVASYLKELGGCLVLTTRTQHWARIKDALSCNVKTITLAEWSIQDVKKILGSCAIDCSNSSIEVLTSVRNPRLLGIAIELIESNTIELLDELSVGRLLFEHMRRTQELGATSIPPALFAELLKRLASAVLARASKQDTDDLRLFDLVQESQLESVASSRFFAAVRGSSSQYEIKPEGLNLALALYLVDRLEREVRNEREPGDRLSTILEPISALDETGKVVLLATQIACLDEQTSPAIRSALIEKFVSLQNLPNNEVDAFSVLAKSVPSAFLQAAESVYLKQEHVASKEWLLYSLLNRRDEPDVSLQIVNSVKRWLSFYSSAPERGMHGDPRYNTATEIDEERTRVLREIEERDSTLTEFEHLFLTKNLIEAPTPKFDNLSRFSFYLLAGLPLEDLAPCIVNWRFSQAFNPSTSAPYEEFEQLLRYNRADWQETRLALLRELEALPKGRLSSIGSWTRAGVLYGTGDVIDALEAESIVDELTRDREHFKGWSRRETYCSVDPCDPYAVEPYNVAETTQHYRQIDLGKVAISRGMNEEGHLFRGARAALARFASDDAVNMHRGFATEVLSRSGFARRQGVLELRHHGSALTKDIALRFLSDCLSSTAKYKDGKDSQESFITAQFSLAIALPHLSAEEQLEAIAGLQSDTILLEVLFCVRTATPAKVEQVLQSALQSGSEDCQAAVLAAIYYSKAALTPCSVAVVKQLIRSSSRTVRHEALALAALSGETCLLKEVVDSGWRAESVSSSDFEDWHGSNAVLKALEAGLIGTELALDRISLSHYGFAIAVLPCGQVATIAARIGTALAKALNYEGDIELPDIETSMPKIPASTPPLVSLSERTSTVGNLASQMDRLAETEEQFDDRQRRMSDAYKRFASDLTATGAGLILSDVTLEGIKAIVGQDPDRDLRWLQMLIGASDSKLRHLHHFALQFAAALGASGNALALKLVTRILTLSPTVRRVTGTAKVPTESITLWSSAASPAMIDICKDRLRTPQKNSDIAREVIAAHLCGKVDLLRSFTDELLAVGRPYEIALALTIVGFGDESTHADSVLSRFSEAKGFIGTAHAAAREAYVRNVWARSWYTQMRNAGRPEDFWRASVLFGKVVDGRFDIWPEISNGPSTVFTAFMPTIEREISSRAAKTQKTREEKLFGNKTPASIMLNTG